MVYPVWAYSVAGRLFSPWHEATHRAWRHYDRLELSSLRTVKRSIDLYRSVWHNGKRRDFWTVGLKALMWWIERTGRLFCLRLIKMIKTNTCQSEWLASLNKRLNKYLLIVLFITSTYISRALSSVGFFSSSFFLSLAGPGLGEKKHILFTFQNH